MLPQGTGQTMAHNSAFMSPIRSGGQLDQVASAIFQNANGCGSLVIGTGLSPCAPSGTPPNRSVFGQGGGMTNPPGATGTLTQIALQYETGPWADGHGNHRQRAESPPEHPERRMDRPGNVLCLLRKSGPKGGENHGVAPRADKRVRRGRLDFDRGFGGRSGSPAGIRADGDIPVPLGLLRPFRGNGSLVGGGAGARVGPRGPSRRRSPRSRACRIPRRDKAYPAPPIWRPTPEKTRCRAFRALSKARTCGVPRAMRQRPDFRTRPSAE